MDLGHLLALVLQGRASLSKSKSSMELPRQIVKGPMESAQPDTLRALGHIAARKAGCYLAIVSREY